MNAAAPGADPQALAALARAFQRRLDELPDHVDASWKRAAALRPLLQALPAGAARRGVMRHLFSQWCGPMPGLQDLQGPCGHLVLLGRVPMLSRLCALALAARPGALRCCVERPVRKALERALGPAFSPLREGAAGGMPVRADVAAWMPIQWACVGYVDLLRAGLWRQAALLRLARLGLPSTLPVPTREPWLPAATLAAEAVWPRVGLLFEEPA